MASRTASTATEQLPRNLPAAPVQLQPSTIYLLKDGPPADSKGTPTWKKPAITPNRSELAEWTTTLEGLLTGCTFDDVVRAMQGMLAGGMAFERDDQDVNIRQRAEIYHLVLQGVPTDILNSVVGELLASEEFFPSAAKWLKACDKPLAERQRMKRRVQLLIQDHVAADQARAFVPEPAHVRLAGMIASYRRYCARYEGNVAAHQKSLWDLAVSTRAACVHTGEPIPAWSTGEEAITLNFRDGAHHVFVEPPPENAPPPSRLPAGVVEPPTATVSAADEFVKHIRSSVGPEVDEELIAQAHAYANAEVVDDLGDA